MSNRILDVQVVTKRLDPHEAEVWVTVTAKDYALTTQVRGRIVGPKSPKHTTIEVAYPLKAINPSPLPALSTCVVIPEPSLWQPEAPFVYDVIIELWENGKCCDRKKIENYALTGSRGMP